MIQSWNKFCITGGIVEFSAKLPGDPTVGGLWPAREFSAVCFHVIVIDGTLLFTTDLLRYLKQHWILRSLVVGESSSCHIRGVVRFCLAL